VALRQKVLVLLRENSRLKKELEKHKAFPFEQLGLNSQIAAIKVKQNDGLAKDLISKAEDALQDALMFKKNSLNQVADLIVTQLKYHTHDNNWLCNVVPVDIDAGLSHNLDCLGSVCLSFGDEKSRYEARIQKLSDKTVK